MSHLNKAQGNARDCVLAICAQHYKLAILSHSNRHDENASFE